MSFAECSRYQSASDLHAVADLPSSPHASVDLSHLFCICGDVPIFLSEPAGEKHLPMAPFPVSITMDCMDTSIASVSAFFLSELCSPNPRPVSGQLHDDSKPTNKSDSVLYLNKRVSQACVEVSLRNSGRAKSMTDLADASAEDARPQQLREQTATQHQGDRSLSLSPSCRCSTLVDSLPPILGSLFWLRNLVVDVCMDQEGFRMVQSTMHLTGYSPKSRSLHPFGHPSGQSEDLSIGGVAEFMPFKRELFAFHHNTALDGGPPILRRIAVNGSETRDYTSRLAILDVKTNGVYTVLGNEPLSIALSEIIHDSAATRPVKLPWRLDYVVGDRTDKSGKVIHGEKTLTPLTFSCSPLLLHPMQGRHISLMHVVRKAVMGKLSAEKVMPPTFMMKGVSQHTPATVDGSIRPHSIHGPPVTQDEAETRQHRGRTSFMQVRRDGEGSRARSASAILVA
ncbi:hypothetical protein CONPUDRAFT_161626 [Coniophora puteana RWD-64-598 SS2]|uniref:Uncharacterized protein n=1 Tax=Coniophora puteana (strain RWD-64-598) TaxID=741705 RepID=A0A5M3N6F4_CONPW|nr:uncharacterized protein CONPUDRAFT_161626 [Coniophora puteana RWD-64-598 SS2]EIW87003.1 hypothetical protein CONPUDRAFT_161626 [Coniophora puteana RWD-64-598 SS2]